MSAARRTSVPARETPTPEPSARESVLWLLAFLRRDLSALRRGERLDLGHDLLRYLRPQAAAVEPRHGEANKMARLEGAAIDQDEEENATTDAQRGMLLLRLQAELVRGVTALERDGRWSLFGKLEFLKAEGMYADSDVDEILVGGGPPEWVVHRRADGTAIRYFEGPLDTVLLATATDLLVRWWSELRRCGHAPCRALFLPRHGRQQYHDAACAFQARWTRFAPTRERDFRAEYTQRLRRKLPATVTPQHRAKRRAPKKSR